jgi:hypothetical protein
MLLSVAVLAIVVTSAHQANRFIRMSHINHEAGTRLDTVIVFSGDHARIRKGLQLLASGETARLFISGANPSAGIWLDRFTKEFGEGRPDVEELIVCCVEYGVRAQNTLQNGIEASCWLQHVGSTKPIGLITSSIHMPRARVALSAHIGGQQIVPIKTEDEQYSFSRFASEFMRFLLTDLIVRTPRTKMPLYWGEFSRGC